MREYDTICYMYLDEEASIPEILLAFLFSCRNTKTFNRLIYEQVSHRKIRNRKSVQEALYRLSKRGLLTKKNETILLTAKGKKYVTEKMQFEIEKSPFDKKQKHSLFIVYDIPESHREKRNWLRAQLIEYGYTMIQLSVWSGPGPLPESFVQKLKVSHLDKLIMIFMIEGKVDLT